MSTVQKFNIVKDATKKIHRFRLQGRTLEFKIKDIPHGTEPVGWVKDAITQIVLKGTEGVKSTDMVGFTFCSKDFARGQGWMRFKPAAEVSVDDVWEKISSIYQSNSTGLNTETFCLGVTLVKMPKGQGRGRTYNSFNEECAKRRGILTINNKDNLCLPRALVVAKAYVDKDPEAIKIRRDIGKLQVQRARELMTSADVSIPEEGAGIPELQQFQRHLQDYKITVYTYGSKGRDVIFEGNGVGPPLNLLHHEGHYNVIVSLKAAFCCSYFCKKCHIPYDHKKEHRCGGTCPGCRQSPSCSSEELVVKCDSCRRSFRGQKCFDNHLQHSICTQIRRCEDCFKVVPTNRRHTCGEIFCKICNKHCPADHLCYIQPDTRSPPTKDFLFIFYDLETRQETTRQEVVSKNGKDEVRTSLLHEPNLCVSNQCCHHCIQETKLVFCQSCGFRQKIFSDEDVISNLLDHIFTFRKKFKNVTVLAHNGGGFDHQFIFKYILSKTDITPDLIMRGTKLISMTVGNVNFIDSLNYFPMALSKLPKAFGFSELKKGYFPHRFNTVAHQNYVGPMPPLEYYDPDNVKDEKAKEALVKWYAEKVEQNYVFDFQKEIVDYCISDVDILAQSCLKFRDLVIKETNVCPFMEATTIASSCNKVFRRNFLKPNTIGIIPKRGYRWRDNQSKVAIQWLVWEEHQRGVNIHHAAKGEEVRVAGVKVDGYCEDTKQVFEFEGCYYHGCPRCFTYQRDTPLHKDPSETLNSKYDTTQAKNERLRSLGYEVIEMWECDFKRRLTDNKELQNYTETHPYVKQTPLDPRDAFYGGRTGNTVEYYKAMEDEKIKYVDVCSLYPWVCKYGKFPVGHPKVYVGSECPPLASISGLVKCKILPPRDLFHPVLPQKMNDKLMFVLCRKCGQNLNYEKCQHSNEERALTGTWVTEEVLKAVEMGYTILETYEVWAYETIQFSNNVSGLFTTMMNKFIKIKQESSGWPANCKTDIEKDQYIERFLQREDIHLEFSKIVDNPGLRSLAKLMLNSFWGKFGQRENQPKTSIINNTAEFFKIMSDPSIYVNTVLPIGDEGNTLIVNWEYREEASDSLSTVNVVIAAFVTAQARLKLYDSLEKLDKRALYYDTDSVIYVSRPNEYDVPTGEFVGDMTDELEKEGLGSYITEFVSGGPKNYAYKFWSTMEQKEKVCCKVKGISLTLEVQKTVNFDSIKEMVLTPDEPVYIVAKHIERTAEHEVVTKNIKKRYQPNSTKRKFLEDHSSEPFGYKKSKNM